MIIMDAVDAICIYWLVKTLRACTSSEIMFYAISILHANIGLFVPTIYLVSIIFATMNHPIIHTLETKIGISHAISDKIWEIACYPVKVWRFDVERR